MQSLWWVWFFGIETCLLRASRAIPRKFAPSKIPRYTVSVVFSVHWFTVIDPLFCNFNFRDFMCQCSSLLSLSCSYTLSKDINHDIVYTHVYWHRQLCTCIFPTHAQWCRTSSQVVELENTVSRKLWVVPERMYMIKVECMAFCHSNISFCSSSPPGCS